MSQLMELAHRGEPLQEELIIDAHAHIGPTYNFFIPWHDAEGMIKVMDKTGIDQTCISAHLAIGPDFKRGNDVVAQVLQNFPDRFLGYVSINPGYEDDIIEELERCFAIKGFFGIKLHPELHKYSVADDKCIPIWEYANEKGLPILSHTWDDAAILGRLATDFPGIKFVVAHASYLFAHGGKEYVDLVKKYNNIYFDIASSYVLYGTIKRMVAALGADRILFGTDFPFFDANVQLGNLVWEDISDDDKKKILGLNFKRIVNLPQIK